MTVAQGQLLTLLLLNSRLPWSRPSLQTTRPPHTMRRGRGTKEGGSQNTDRHIQRHSTLRHIHGDIPEASSLGTAKGGETAATANDTNTTPKRRDSTKCPHKTIIVVIVKDAKNKVRLWSKRRALTIIVSCGHLVADLVTRAFLVRTTPCFLPPLLTPPSRSPPRPSSTHKRLPLISFVSLFHLHQDTGVSGAGSVPRRRH